MKLLYLLLLFNLSWSQEIEIDDWFPPEFDQNIYESDIINFSVSASSHGEEIYYSWMNNGTEVSTESHYDFVTNYVGDNSAGEYEVKLDINNGILQNPTRILFIGNSITYYNGGINNHLEGFVNSLGDDEVECDAITQGGARLQNHWNNGNVITSIQMGNYDYVVLQERTATPVDEPELFYQYVTLFDSVITASGAETILFQSWPYRGTFDTMIEDQSEAFEYISNELDVNVVNVARAWQLNRTEYPDMELFNDDGNHPNVYGTYLAVCSFYSYLWNATPEGVEYVNSDEITEQEQLALQHSAWESSINYPFIDNLSLTWNVTVNNVELPEISIDIEAFDFEMYQNEIQEQTMTILNTGISPLEIEIYKGEILVDMDENIYQTVRIGNQVWTAENIKTTYYRNGDEILRGYSANEWSNIEHAENGAYCIYDNNEDNADIYGYLYNWYAVGDERNIAPDGWHIPTDEEWKELEMALGMSESDANDSGWRGANQGSELAGRADLWATGDLESNGAFGISNFLALPSGYRHEDGGFYAKRYNCYFWTSNELSADWAWRRKLHHSTSEIHRSTSYEGKGFAVRLLKDVDTLTYRDGNFRDEWLVITPMNLTIQPGESAEVTISINTEDVEPGEYSQVISVTSNDLVNNVIEIPVSLIVNEGSSDIEDDILPHKFELLNPYPNPFNPITVIGYQLPVNSAISINIYNVHGQLVEKLVDEQIDTGHHEVVWNVKNNPNGLYIVKMSAGNYISTQKIMLLK
jgi:uncharacterized protein (TIGR02145 family)